jgi:hypothetical protein
MAEPPTLCREELALLLRVTAHPRAVIGSEYVIQSENGFGLIEKGLLKPYANGSEFIEVDGEDRELVWDSTSRTYRYFTPAAGWVVVPSDRLKSYRVDFDALLAVVSRWYKLSARSGPTILVRDLLWDLGETWISKRRVSVLFLRRARLPETLSKVREAMQGYPRRSSSLILTDGRPSGYGPDIPGNPMFMALLDFFPPEKVNLNSIDTDSLAIFDFGVREPKRKWSPVECDEDGGYLRLHDREFRFSGLTHRRIIRILYEAWKRGEPRMRTASVLEEAESRSRAMSQAFGGCREAWKDVIGYGDGFCWFKV